MDKSFEYLIPFLIAIFCLEALYFFQRKKGFIFASLAVLVASLLGASLFLAFGDQSGIHYFLVWFLALAIYGIVFLFINLVLTKANDTVLPHIVFLSISLFLSPFWWFVPLLVSCGTGYDCI
ncbi:hypothetical protein [Shewanella baltica]|uniref:hypothetical protein n=1 Tax=Shewanella baltica TaxID=62322 RepID=UPI00217E3918|nr:hypothetical protein [Shewanella baltica]MCS6193899.1 hypothetical protein [Shewanella baltica]